MRIPIARLLSITFIAAIIGFAAQLVILAAAAAVTHPNVLVYVIHIGTLFAFLSFATVLLFGLAYAANARFRSVLGRHKAAAAFAVSGAVGPAIPYLVVCTGHFLMRCGFENARDAVLSAGTIFSGAVFGFAFFTIFWNFLHSRREAL